MTHIRYMNNDRNLKGDTMKAYEVLNPSIPDMFLDEQIEAGCNNWRVDAPDGSVHFGRTAEEAEAIARGWCGIEG